jgi:hypothetical protein
MPDPRRFSSDAVPLDLDRVGLAAPLRIAGQPAVESRVGGLAPRDERPTEAIDALSGVGIASPADRPAVAGGGGLPSNARNSRRAAPAISVAVTDPQVQVGGGPERGPLPGSDADTSLARRDAQPFDVPLDVPEGIGGVGAQLAVKTGLMRRTARSDSQILAAESPRFLRRSPGGRPQLSAAAALATDAFRQRSAALPNPQTPSVVAPETEESIELGLDFLARFQQDDGRWTFDGFDEERPAFVSDGAATGLALLAFQGAGYHHLDHKYKDHVRRGLEVLISNQASDGSLFIPGNDQANRYAQFYSHGIAAIAVCEAYGMTQDPSLREPAQRAIDYIVSTQAFVRAARGGEFGGWRYVSNTGADTSVTGWMMMALKSGELAGLEVPGQTYRRIEGWLDRARGSASENHLYRYNPFAPDTAAQRHGRVPSKTMTAVGLLMRLYTGWNRDHPDLRRGAAYLQQRLPALGSADEDLLELSRDTYYWYYATQVMFHMGGEYWSAWQQRLHPLLINSQLREGPLVGSWDPLKPLPDRWAGQGGRLYVTAMNLLSLEVQHRHLPLYEETAR